MAAIDLRITRRRSAFVSLTAMSEGFTKQRLERLAAIENWHFWFVGRRAMVEDLLHTHASLPGLHLDLGCGTGHMLKTMTRRGVRAVGVDMRPEGLVSTRRINPDAILVRADATHLPFKAGSFDSVTVLDVLEHVDDDALLSEIRTILRPGGAAVLTVPAMPWLWSWRDDEAGHLRRYTRPALAWALSRAGFEVVVMRYYQCLLFPLVAASRLIGRRNSRTRDLEERRIPFVNVLFSWINSFEARLGRHVALPWGSSLVAVCARP